MPSKDKYHHGNLRHALMGAALDTIKEQGAEKLSLRALARELGVSQAAPYRHFGDKVALLSALASDGFMRLAREMESVMGDIESDPVKAFQQGGQAYVRFAQCNPETYRLMYSMPPQNFDNAEMDGCQHGAFQLLERTIAAGIEKGVFNVLNKDAIVLASWSLVHGYAQLVIDGIIDVSNVDAALQFQAVGEVINRGVLHD